jgi:hypothetical protein
MKKFCLTVVILIVVVLQISGIEHTYSRSSRKSLQSALDSLENNDTLYIRQGIYVQKTGVTLRDVENVSIIGDGEVWIISQDLYSDVFMVRDCGPVTFENLKMRHQEPLEEYECNGGVLFADNVTTLIVDGCELNGCGAIGLWSTNCGTLEITNCFIHDNSWTAFYLTDIQSLTLSYCTIVDNASFFEAYRVEQISMHDNMIAYNSSDE